MREGCRTASATGNHLMNCFEVVGGGGITGYDASSLVPAPVLVDPPLMPSVRCGLEMALVHLLAGATSMSIGTALSTGSGLPYRAFVEINTLSTRTETSSKSRKVRMA